MKTHLTFNIRNWKLNPQHDVNSNQSTVVEEVKIYNGVGRKPRSNLRRKEQESIRKDKRKKRVIPARQIQEAQPWMMGRKRRRMEKEMIQVRERREEQRNLWVYGLRFMIISLNLPFSSISRWIALTLSKISLRSWLSTLDVHKPPLLKARFGY